VLTIVACRSAKQSIDVSTYVTDTIQAGVPLEEVTKAIAKKLEENPDWVPDKTAGLGGDTSTSASAG
jgi:hypothetical protein